jgi:hypothetical protein
MDHDELSSGSAILPGHFAVLVQGNWGYMAVLAFGSVVSKSAFRNKNSIGVKRDQAHDVCIKCLKHVGTRDFKQLCFLIRT